MLPAAGVLLIAHPLLSDPNFRRTVVFLCEHEDDVGSFGLVVNRALPDRMNETILGFDAFDTPIYQGGPVQPDTLHVLHTNRDLIDGAVEVVDGVSWGGDPEMIRLTVENQIAPLESFRFYIGYAGWGEGQLKQEIDEGAWVLHRARAAHLFEVEPDRLWRGALREMGGEYAVLANYPEDPRMN